MSIPWESLQKVVADQPYRLLFATVSGAHLYGFDSPDSDFDLRGCHVLPAREVLGLDSPTETIEVSSKSEGLELDLVTHDAKKFLGLLLKRNGYVLEQLCSPLVVQTSEAHSELLELVPRLVTKHHSRHYLGFATSEWALTLKSQRLKPLLYCYRVLLTGIHLMRTGRVEANLATLAAERRMTEVADLIETKRRSAELQSAELDWKHHEKQLAILTAELEEAERLSKLPHAPSCRSELSDLLVRLRL